MPRQSANSADLLRCRLCHIDMHMLRKHPSRESKIVPCQQDGRDHEISQKDQIPIEILIYWFVIHLNDYNFIEICQVNHITLVYTN